MHTVIAGLGGRVITRASLRSMLEQAIAGKLESLTFLDLDHKIVNGVLAREREQRRTGPIAENILRDLGVAASKTG